MIPSRVNQWCGKDVSLLWKSMRRAKPSWTRARSAAKKLLCDCDTWDKAMRGACGKEPDRTGQQLALPRMRAPAIRKQTPSQRTNWPGESA